MTATQFLYAVATGNSIPAGEQCWLCGGNGAGGPLREFVKDTFTDHDKAKCPTSKFVCIACAWCAAEENEELTRKLNADRPQKIRGYSHFVIDGQWHVFTKSHKREMRQLLCAPPNGDWLAVVADSGQKHLVFRSPISIGSNAVVQFELKQVRYEPPALNALVAKIESAMQCGFSKTSIEMGVYNDPATIQAFGVDKFLNFEELVKPQRGTGIMSIALWLSQK